MIAAHVDRRCARRDCAPDDVGYPKDATIEAVRLGIYALVRLEAYDELAAALLDQRRPAAQPLVAGRVRVPARRESPCRGPAHRAAHRRRAGTRAFAAKGLGTLKHAARGAGAAARWPRTRRSRWRCASQAVRALG